ncbi:DUF2236 domain-containing protein [Svornostia abyssi]|uniref:DUF2236 domain-containing protein n=1 Tax=Svornostia abyssi TaxID=2898438 RepID=A0ABY5PB19_9ACTN|nr:DUF2236 domain-containing protein [Parviterribacteraceae bacterium J379]
MTTTDDKAVMNRRTLIGAGAALGAGATLPTWTWAASESIAGVGGVGIPPWEVWDDLADPVISAVIERGETAQVNTLLRQWTQNGMDLPAGLPADLRDFMEEARKLPDWVEMDKLQWAVDFNKRRGIYLGVAYGFVSGMMSSAIPHEARAVYYSKGGADMKDRISKTAKLGYDIGSERAFHSPHGEMIVTCVKTRMAHAGVRHLLPQLPYWSHIADEVGGIPISQRDILVTWHSLPTSVMRSFRKWGVRMPARDRDAFLHSWQVAAHLLGVRDEYIPASWEAAEAQAQQILDPFMGPTEEGKKLAKILVNLASEVDGGYISRPLLESLTRTFLGPKISGWLGTPRHPWQDELLAAAWPIFVGVHEGTLWVAPRFAKQFWNFFAEILRQGALWYLGEGKRLYIEIPDMNNPNFESGGPTGPGTGSPGGYP